mgnify:CR=1 FL=1
MFSLLMLLACGPEVGLIGYRDKNPDTAATTDTTMEPSGEPSSPDTGVPPRTGVSGYTYMHLRQVACPACVGESQEIRISFDAEFHQPISDSHTDWLPQSGECTNSLVGVDPSTIPMNVVSVNCGILMKSMMSPARTSSSNSTV